MSSTTEIPNTSEFVSSGSRYTSSAQDTVSGSQPQGPDSTKIVTRTANISTLFTSSILNSVENTEQRPVQKEITEEEAASILVLMRRKYAVTDPETRMREPSSSQTARPASRVASGSQPCARLRSAGKAGKAETIPGNKKASVKQLRSVSRRASWTGAVFVPKAKVGTKTKKTTKGNGNKYNTFRTKASKVLGAQVVKRYRKGTSFNAIIAAIWREVPDVDKEALGDWTAAKWKDYLTKLVTGGQLEREEVKTVVKKKEVKAATRIQRRRNLEGKTKK